MIRGIREPAVVTLGAIVLAVYFTWPLAPRMGSVGRTDSGDGQFSIWNVAWVAHAILSPGARVFDANIFHPARGTLAYSEANLGAGLFAVPAYWLTRNPYAAHNSVVLMALVLSVAGMYVLALRLSGSRPGALVAAIVFTFCPHVFSHTAHIQLLMIWPLPFVLFALHAFVDRPAARRAGLLGVSIAVQALFCAYYGVLAGLLAGAGVLYYAAARGTWRSARWWGLVAFAAVLSVALVLPVFVRYLQLQQETGFGRALDEARLYSADWGAYLASSAWLHEWMLDYLPRWNEVLFPGFTAILFAAAGTVSGLSRARETTIFYAAVALLAFWISFGPAAGLYSALYYTVPVFSLLRAPARFGLAVSFALAILAALGVSALASGGSGRRRWMVAVILILAVLELSMTMPFREVSPFSPADRMLAGARPGPVAQFPFFYRGEELFRHSRYMLGSTAHWQPLVNGYSDFIPADYRRIAPLLASFPNPEGFDILREKRARYVVFNLGLYDWRNREAALFRINAYREYLRPMVQDEDVLMYEIVRWPDRHPALGSPEPLAPR